MGLSASSINLLGLTARSSDIKQRLSFIALEKMSLTRDMNKVTQEYHNSLNSKVLKWSDNGYTYNDLSYSLLMTPTPSNAGKPYMITDTNGRVVLSPKHAQYAELVAPGGNPPGNWDNVRPQVLADITGQTVEDLQEYDSAYKEYIALDNEVAESKAKQPASDDPGYETWKAAHDNLVNERDEAYDYYNSIFDAETESELKFYDAIFATVADKGWVCNDNVNDSRYLNEMFQNNMFMITSVKLQVVENPNHTFSYDNIYSTDLISNHDKVYTVNDSEAQDQAFVKYEAAKATINKKEQELDFQSERLETEQQAIATMIENIQEVMDKNIENTFNISA